MYRLLVRNLFQLSINAENVEEYSKNKHNKKGHSPNAMILAYAPFVMQQIQRYFLKYQDGMN